MTAAALVGAGRFIQPAVCNVGSDFANNASRSYNQHHVLGDVKNSVQICHEDKF